MNIHRLKMYSASGRIPKYESEGASGFDLSAYITEDTKDAIYDDKEQKWAIAIGPGDRKLIMTGFHFELPAEYEIQVRPRSGMSFKHGQIAMFGTIDSDYRGDVGVILFNLTNDFYAVHDGDRIAQGVLNHVPKVESFHIVSDRSQLTTTVRGDKGFGSSGFKL